MDRDLTPYDGVLLREALLAYASECGDDDADFLENLAESIGDCVDAGTTLHLNFS